MTDRDAQRRQPAVAVVPSGLLMSTSSPAISALNSAEGHAALMAGDLGRVIRLARTALKLDQHDLARKTNVAQTSVSRAERGALSDPELLGRLCDGLDILSDQAGDRDPTYSEDMRRRDLLRNVAAAVSAAMLPAAVTEPAYAGRIGAPEIEACWEALRRLQTLEDQQGGGTVYQLTAGIASHLQRAVGQASYGLITGTRLREVTATAAVRAGWQAFDSSRRGSARRWWLEARHLSDLGDGGHDAGVMALAAMAVLARKDGRGHDAIGLAQAAHHAAGAAAHPKLVSLLAAREAIGHACIGDVAAATSCLATARRWLDRGNTGDAPSWLGFWGAGDLAVHEMLCARTLKNRVAAEHAAREAVRASSPTTALRNHSLYSSYLGNVLAASGELDESISVTKYVLEAGAVAGSQRVAVEIRKTAAILRRHDYRPANQFADHIDHQVPAA